MGKSRLALETAHLLSGEHRDGGWLCELAHVPEPGAVAFALAAAVGVRQVQGATIEDSLVEALAGKDVLVVVDNCEHVLDGFVPLLERVLHHCAHVHVLATSRERLAADGEMVVEVPPLELPDENADPTAEWEHPAAALELMRDRVAAVRPGFRPDDRQRSAVMEIARRLDGVPLALELAAASPPCAPSRSPGDSIGASRCSPEPPDCGPHLAGALAATGNGAWMRGDLARARTLSERAVAAAGDATAARYGWQVLGAVALFEGRLDDAGAAVQRVRELALHDGDHYNATLMLGSLAMVQRYAGDTPAAIANAEASRLEAARTGSPSAAAWAAYALGEVLAATEPAEALIHLDRVSTRSGTVQSSCSHVKATTERPSPC